MRETELFALMCVGDGDTAELVAVVLDDLFGAVADDDDELLGPERSELLETVCEEGFTVDSD